MAKKGFAPPVTNFSVSCDPTMVAWLNEYAHKNRTTRSKVVRKALVDFRAEHKMSDVDEKAPVIDVQLRCDECDSAVIRIPGGRNLCTRSSAHMRGD